MSALAMDIAKMAPVPNVVGMKQLQKQDVNVLQKIMIFHQLKMNIVVQNSQVYGRMKLVYVQKIMFLTQKTISVLNLMENVGTITIILQGQRVITLIVSSLQQYRQILVPTMQIVLM